MSDIVERLRRRPQREMLYLDGCIAAGYGPTVESQAADEIERLCLEFTHSAKTCEMLQTDNERLRVERDEWQARAIALFWRGDADDVTAGKIRQATEAIRAALGTQEGER